MFSFKRQRDKQCLEKRSNENLPKVTDDDLQIFYAMKNSGQRLESNSAILLKQEKQRKNFQIKMANILCK